MTPCTTTYYYPPLMSKAPPELLYPLRLARGRESLAGGVGTEQMRRLAEMLLEGAGWADFELRFGHDDGGQACVLGRIQAKLKVLCQRCLEPMDITVERQVRLALVRDDTQAAQADAGYDPLLLGDRPISLSGLVEDELILAMPNFPRHPRGECEMPRGAVGVDHTDESGEGGEDHNGDTAGESGEENPFTVLKSLKPRKTP